MRGQGDIDEEAVYLPAQGTKGSTALVKPAI